MTRTLEEIEARIAELEAASAKSTHWGAAVGARWEELKNLYAEVRHYRGGNFASQPPAAPVTFQQSELKSAATVETDHRGSSAETVNADYIKAFVKELRKEPHPSFRQDKKAADLIETLYLMTLGTRAVPQPVSSRQGIYIASKVKHADRWRFMRDKVGEPIISTWIDEAGEGETSDHNDLWRRCLTEASNCALLVVYREPDEILKGAWVELGAALTNGVPVFAVGLEEYTIAKYRGIRHFKTMKEAMTESRKLLASCSVTRPHNPPPTKKED